MKKKTKNNDIKKVLKYFKNTKISILIIFLTMIIGCIIGVLIPVISANVLANLTDFNSDKVLFFAILLFIATFINQVNSFITNYVYLRGFKRKLLLNIRKDIIKNIFDMKVLNFDKHTSGEFAERIKNDPENISRIMSVVQYSFLNLITDILVLGYTFYLNYILGLIYLGTIILIIIFEKIAFKKQKKMLEKSKKLNEKTSTILNESLRGIRDIKYLNMIRPLSKYINNNLDTANEADINKNIMSSLIYDVVHLLRGLSEVMIIIIGILLIRKNMLSITNLIIIYMYKSNIFDMIWCYTSIKEYFVEFKVAASRIFELTNPIKYPKEHFGKKSINNIKGTIELKNLSFKYDNKKVLDKINLKIEENDTVAVVGASGSGKTTLLNLLIKGYYVDDSKIFIDNVDINELSMDAIRGNISIITQNPYLFNLTIKENLELSGDNISKKDIVEVCKIAQIHDFIESLPKKYNTLIGEGGVNLSGGQKQRLAIARALLKKSKIILFDEATSALDNITQNELQKAINSISKDYTIIIVAHRLSTIKECSRIYVLDEGKIVGVGTHEELLENNEYYKKLYLEEII